MKIVWKNERNGKTYCIEFFKYSTKELFRIALAIRKNKELDVEYI
jgi:hypothetical protein